MGRGLDGYFLMPVLAGCAVLKVRALRAPAAMARFGGACRPPGLERFPVAMAWGKHLFPFRTEQLSPTAPMVLGLHGPGRVGRRRFNVTRAAFGRLVVVLGPAAPGRRGLGWALSAALCGPQRRSRR